MLNRYKQLLPIFFLTVCCIITVVTAIQGNVLIGGESYDFAMSPRHYGGVAILVLAYTAFFKFRAFYKYVLATIFLLGQLRTVGFTPLDFSIGLGTDTTRIQLDTISIFLGILIYAVNTTKINAAILGVLKPSEAKKHEQTRIEIDAFAARFAHKSPEELGAIINANKLVPAAVEAARLLLKQKTQFNA